MVGHRGKVRGNKRGEWLVPEEKVEAPVKKSLFKKK